MMLEVIMNYILSIHQLIFFLEGGGLNLALTDKKGKVKSYTSTILFKYFWDFHVMYIKLWKDKLWVYGILFNFVNFSPNIQGIIQNSTKN